jgi:nucleotide-binding universal stress UspA family protein
VRTFLEQGDPAEVLVEHARHAEMLVLGNHGRGALAGALVGSVAQRCAQRAPCPLVLVPLPPTPDPTPSR